ncbi:sulfotransferase family protein [Streptomyces sp. JJ36]|uniref:sulfotransferase family protein n=1 Tax=Streptomyces sp. JJ36 TaxID=2736645 RepID=UPI001F254711|nr:sulfotransferase family protein [Streptomyces sp. JJ36]MCF6521564.1 sulfotransferase family protein [Streptomyces sp. JJ36]
MLELIGAGFGRTGTLSMKAALERLGHGPAYHMAEILAEPRRLRDWSRVLGGAEPDWYRIFDGYRSTVDWPGAAYWRELCAAFPQAKVLLTVRDPERWYDSTRRTIHRFSRDPAGFPGEEGAAFRAAVRTMVWEGTFGGRFEDKAHAIRVFEEHNAAVQREIPADRLLVYRAGDGWEPLCAFLGTDVPDEDFPHLNDAASMQEAVAQATAEGGFPRI